MQGQSYLQENIKFCDKQLYPMPGYINDESRRIRKDRNRVSIASLER